jgi:hypothetical protein
MSKPNKALLGGLAGDLVVGHWWVQRAEPEQGLEGGHWGGAAVVAKDVLVEGDGQWRGPRER